MAMRSGPKSWVPLAHLRSNFLALGFFLGGSAAAVSPLGDWALLFCIRSCSISVRRLAISGAKPDLSTWPIFCWSAGEFIEFEAMVRNFSGGGLFREMWLSVRRMVEIFQVDDDLKHKQKKSFLIKKRNLLLLPTAATSHRAHTEYRDLRVRIRVTVRDNVRVRARVMLNESKSKV